MIKLTVRYPDEEELQRFMAVVEPLVLQCKPPLSRTGRKGPESDYYRRDIWLKTTGTNAKKRDDGAGLGCNIPRNMV